MLRRISAVLARSGLFKASTKVPLVYQSSQFSFRTNSTSTIDKIIEQTNETEKPIVNSESTLTIANNDLKRFQELLSFHRQNPIQKSEFEFVLNEFNDLIKNFQMRQLMTESNLTSYVVFLNHTLFWLRNYRLRSKKNRDKDQYNLYKEENLLKDTVLLLGDYIKDGEFNQILSQINVSRFIFAINQLDLKNEIIGIWESGVENEETSDLYLKPEVLAVVLPITYASKRFTYEEIIKIFELNVNQDEPIDHELLSSFSRIAVIAGDYARALKNLEILLSSFDKTKGKALVKLEKAVLNLHLNLIGSCKDIPIAKHFFDKVIQNRLPYTVRLKGPHIVSLMENANESRESIDSIKYFWLETVKFESNGPKMFNLNASNSNLHNTFYKIFFTKYPELTEESFNKLIQTMSDFKEVLPIDEILLNSVINNYSWESKEVLEQLIENYNIYNINKTPVANRVILKKTGEIEGYTVEEILDKWNKSLIKLDASYSYIPRADWASLRASSIQTKYFESRKPLYMSVLKHYCDYMQDKPSVYKFTGGWKKDSEHGGDIVRFVESKDPKFDYDELVKSTQPTFNNLTPNVDFKKVSMEIVSRFKKY